MVWSGMVAYIYIHYIQIYLLHILRTERARAWGVLQSLYGWAVQQRGWISHVWGHGPGVNSWVQNAKMGQLALQKWSVSSYKTNHWIEDVMDVMDIMGYQPSVWYSMVLSDGGSTWIYPSPNPSLWLLDLMVPRFWAPTTDESDSKINLFLSILDPVLVSWKKCYTIFTFGHLAICTSGVWSGCICNSGGILCWCNLI